MQSTPILPGIQPPGHHAAGSRPDGPPFASSLEEAGISLTSEVTAPASRDSGAAESALDPHDESRSDSGHSPVSMLTDRPADEASETGHDENIPNPLDDDDVVNGVEMVEGLQLGSPLTGSVDGSSIAAEFRTAGDGTSTIHQAESMGHLSGSKDLGSVVGNGPSASAQQLSIDSQGLGGHLGISGALIDANVNANVNPRSSGQNFATAIDRPSGAPATAATAASGTPGSIVIPEGMQTIEPNAAALAARPTRPASTTPSNRRDASGRGMAAVNRAEALNASIRRDQAAAETAARPSTSSASSASSTSSPIAAESSIVDPSAGRSSAGLAKPMSGSAEAQSLPNSSASLAPQDAETDPRRTAAGVARGLQALSAQKGGSLIMRLDPPNLGQVRMELNMEAGRVSVLITAAGDTARSLLRDNLGVLRHALEDRGFAVERLAVESTTKTSSDASTSRNDRGDGQDARSGSESSDRQDAGGERSRGRRDHAPDRRSDQEQAESARFNEVLADSGATADP